jgi:FixJ family two-component response regulator
MKKSSRGKRTKGKEGERGPQAFIAIVDDEESVREALQSLLKSMGFRAEGFASGEDFLQSALLPGTTCLILDVRMPGMGGLELQRQLAAQKRRIPIIFVTAHGDEDTRARALQAGAVDFLAKPFSEDALLTAVHSALEHGRNEA